MMDESALKHFQRWQHVSDVNKTQFLVIFRCFRQKRKMPREKYSRSPSRSKKSKRSKSRDRDRERQRDYDRDKDRKYKKSSKSSRSRDYSPDSRRKRDRYRRRSSSRSNSSASSSPSHSSSRSSSRYKPPSRREKSESRSKSTGPSAPPPPIISERFNFQDAVGVLDSNRDSVADIERNEFTPQSFSSTAKKLPERVKIDLDMGTIELPAMPNQEEEVDTLFNPKFFGDEKERMQRWVRKLMLYRQPRMETN